jgi:hypothetical protein
VSRGLCLLLAFSLTYAPPPAASGRGDDDGTDHAFVEVVAEPPAPFVGQPVRISVRFGFTADFRRDHVVPLFAHPLEVPVQLELPWIERLEGARAREPASAEGGDAPLRAALNDGVATLRRLPNERRDGRDFERFELERAYLPERAGSIAIPAPVLRFAWASQFDDDLLRGRVARDRRVAVVQGRPLEVKVAALPEAGRPPRFAGAVGTLTLRAELAAPAARPDGTIRLVVTIEGEGNLEALATPGFPELEPFHRIGTLEEKSTTKRTITCDLKRRSAATREVPALSFVFFDPKPPAGYRTVETRAIPIEGGTGAATDSGGPPPSPVASDATAATSRGGAALLIVAIAGIALLAVVVIGFVRRRARQAGDPAEARASAAAAAFAERARQPGADLAAALADYLAARLETTPAAVIAPELAARLRARAIAPDLAARAAGALQALVAARYGAGRTAPTQELPQLVRDLEAAFTAGGADRSAGTPRR